MRSMTGFGRSKNVVNGREYNIEIRSVNHRYNDISVKLPKSISYLEEDIRKEISKFIIRGKLDVSITFIDFNSNDKIITINNELAKIYIKELKELAIKENINDHIEVVDISKFPDVLEIKQNEKNEEEIKKELLICLNEAIDNLNSMKVKEGNKIKQDLEIRINSIEDMVNNIFTFSTGLIEEYVVKLEERINEILKNQEIDKTRLAQEVVIYADKCSIEEEVTRLNSHISQFKNLLNSNEAIGKKLDFIIQEMNRETNTIGSKANNLEITNGVIDIKTEIENIREQVQNIE